MPLTIRYQDITTMECDAIVNPTDSGFSGSGGTDYAVHTAAGPELRESCALLDALETGAAAATGGGLLPAGYVIHTVGPVWQDGTHNERVLLRSCYLNALFLADHMGLTSLAFPLISSGTFGFPRDQVLRIAVRAITDFLNSTDRDMDVYLCILNRSAYTLQSESELERFLTRSAEPVEALSAPMPGAAAPKEAVRPKQKKHLLGALQSRFRANACSLPMADAEDDALPPELSDWIRQQDDSFSLMLLKLIDRKGMTDVACYKKANVSKATFWKINNDPAYKPSKTTVLAFAIALELTLEETQQLLETVGFTLSRSNTFDMIIRFYIMNGNYDIYEINAALFRYDQVCLGC